MKSNEFIGFILKQNINDKNIKGVSKVEFVKMHGIGNDFIIINDMEEKISLTKGQISLLCDRHFGIGADGFILVRPSKKYDVKMMFYNQDGTEAAMCGNGVRCFAKFVCDKGIVKENQFHIETNAGEISSKIINDKVQVDMGKVDFCSKHIPVEIEKNRVIDEKLSINQKEIIFSSVLVGVPHTIIEVDDLEKYPKKKVGPFIEKHRLFPSGTNVDFVEVLNSKEVKMVTWERGVGLTLACGTGACAVATILIEKGKVQDQIFIHLPGGDLTIDLVGENIFMLGPAKEVYKGDIDIQKI